MSTQVLGDVCLVTNKEVEAMLSAVIVPEETIDAKIATEATNRDDAIGLVTAELNTTKATVDANKAELNDKIVDEAAIRARVDNGLDERLTEEVGARKNADNALVSVIDAAKVDIQTAQRSIAALQENATTLQSSVDDLRDTMDAADSTLRESIETVNTTLTDKITEMKTYERAEYPRVFAERLSGLPIAMITVTNDDKSLSIGDTIATVDTKYFPKRSFEFTMYSEQLTYQGTSKTVMLILRLDNNGNINVVNMFDVSGATAATDVATVTYFTEA